MYRAGAVEIPVIFRPKGMRICHMLAPRRFLPSIPSLLALEAVDRLGSASAAAPTSLINLEAKKTITGKRSRRGSIHFTSPKRTRRSMALPLTELYTCHQEKRDARAAKDRSEASPSSCDVPAVKVA